jgi:tripartite ATP-independent transporter DctP family solute receptor
MQRLTCAVFLALALVLAASGAVAAEFTLMLAHAGPVSEINDDYVGATALKKYVEEKSGGRIKVDIYPGNQLGNYQEVMEQIQNDALQAAHTSIDGVTPFLPELSVLDMQYVIPGDAVVYKFMEGPFFGKLGEAVKGKLANVRLVGVSDGGRWRSFFTTRKEVKSAGDLKGLKIRTINSPLQQEFVRQLGGAATPVPWGELYTALATGVVDGTKNATPDIMSNKFNESIKFGILDRHTFLFGFYWLSDTWLNSLPADLQKVVLDGFTQAAAIQTKFNKDQEDKANAAFVAAGGTLHEPTAAERATFTGARDAMIAWYKAKYGDTWLKIMLENVELAKQQAGYKE